MSSGEKAKPPATFEERNPFDISRRSGTEVASEIAKRMAAWKQARARTSPAPAAVPNGDERSPHVAAPVQPARMPKSAALPPTAPRVPYFASASATRRAMPPAPSLKQSSQVSQPPSVDPPAAQAAEAVLEQASPRPAEPTVKPETSVADATADAMPVGETPLRMDAAPPEASEPVRAEPDDTERRRAEARAIKARWIAAHDLDALIDTSTAAKAPVDEEAAASARETGSGEDRSVREPQAAAGDPDSPDEISDQAASRDELLLDEPAEPERDAPLDAVNVAAPSATPEIAAAAPVHIAAPDEVRHLEPTFDAPNVPVPPATTADRGVANEAPALDLAALDEMAGRREPTFDPPAGPAMSETNHATHEPIAVAEDDIAGEPRTQPAASIATERTTPADDDALEEGLSIAALDEAAGRKEPTFDEPPHRKAGMTESPARIEAASEPALERNRAADRSLHRGVAAPDEVADRKEPAFDQPVRPAKPAAAPHIALRPIETRIEARRVETLRADPKLSVRRPIFPHIELGEWDVPPMVAAHARRARRGTGWAIGLGSILLVAGITAPAAIWQQGRQVGDQAALVSPAPAMPQEQASAPADATATASPPVQATLPDAPQPEYPSQTPAAATQPSIAPSPAAPQAEPPAPTVVAEDAEAAKPAADEAETAPTTALGAIKDGGEVQPAPVVAPSSPMVNLASETGADAAMVARPFVPQGGDGPFLRAPTTGAASVPVAGAPAQSASVGVKPSLMVQLKPKASTTVSATKPVASTPVARKPKPFFQQSPEQMFETLIETLSEGKPVNPATKPASPSSRR
jgi:hypothetical protein